MTPRPEGLTEAEISLLPTEPGECPYCKTPLGDGALADGRPVRVCKFVDCLYLRTGEPFRQAPPVLVTAGECVDFNKAMDAHRKRFPNV